MSLNKKEKLFLKELVSKELVHVKKERKTLVVDADLGLKFLKSEHEYEDFLKDLLKKLK